MVERKRFSRLDVGGDGPEQRRLALVRAMVRPSPLDGGVGLPARLQEVVHAQALVPTSQIGMVRAPRAAGIREHQDALHVIHESLSLGEVGASGPTLDHETR